MNSPTIENLDVACAQTAQEISNKFPQKKRRDTAENLVTKALAVLEAQGVYALFLFLDSQTSQNLKSAAEELQPCLKSFLNATPAQDPMFQNSSSDPFVNTNELSQDLDRLLLAKDLLRQTMVYTRYHLKAPAARKGGSDS